MNDYVLRLDVSVDDPIRMQLPDSCANLLHEVGSFDLRHGLTSLELLVQLPPHSQLKNDVDVLLVVEEPEHFDDVGVV